MFNLQPIGDLVLVEDLPMEPQTMPSGLSLPDPWYRMGVVMKHGQECEIPICVIVLYNKQAGRELEPGRRLLGIKEIVGIVHED